MQDTGERRNKLLLIIVFFGIITAFFYCLIVGTMPKYKSVSSRKEFDQTEIIVQHAWFNHRSGAFHKIYLAEQQVIARTDRAQSLCDGIMVGTLLAMMIFFFGVFLFYSSHSGMLWFSLSCLCAAVHYLIYESKQIMVLFPNLNWHMLDTVSRIGYSKDKDLLLTQKEFSLLLQLARNNGQIITKEKLYESVWGRPLVTDSTALYTAISRLNTKLADENTEITISYLRNKGYLLERV